MSDPFAAFPLATNSKCIRVFEVCPASSTAPEHDHQIYGELSVIDLNDNPLFSALSYVWGVHSTTPHFVHCGASRIKVTPNCFSALVNLRKKLINEPLVIWVDAICINQNDDAEKSHQIPLMGDIYSKATSTCIWLGEGTAGTDRAMQYLATAGFVSYFRVHDGKFGSWPFAAAFSTYLSRYSAAKHPYPFSRSMKWRRHTIQGEWMPRIWLNRMKEVFPTLGNKSSAVAPVYTTTSDLAALLSREWIQRVWTYQEILLSSNAIVICGDQHLSWARFSRSVIFLSLTVPEIDDHTFQWSSVILNKAAMRASESVCLNSNETTELEDYARFLRKMHKIYRVLIWTPFVLFLLSCVWIAVLLWAFMMKKEQAATVVVACCIGLPITCLFDTIVSGFRHRIDSVTFGRAGMPLRSLLVGLYCRKATAPRDMALGMWGILQRQAMPAPAPDQNVSTGRVYLMFSRLFITSMNSLEPLLLAAAQSYPGQPSWVPDWSAYGTSGWSPFIASRLSDGFGGKRPAHRSNSWEAMGMNISNDQADISYEMFSLAENESVLQIRAMRSPSISQLHPFQETQEVYVATERDLHIQNLKLLIGLAGSFSDRILHDIGIKAEGSCLEWAKLFTFTRDIWPASDFLDLQLRSKRRKAIFRTHIHICNQLAKQNKMGFSLGERGLIGNFGGGICSADVKAGDFLVWVVCLRESLVVRAISEDERDAKIISPAIVWEHWLSRDFFEQERHEYRIY